MRTSLQLEIHLHPQQHKVFVDQTRFIVLVAGRRFGKTTLAVNRLLESALTTPKSLNWYVAPTYKQAKMIAWKMLCELVPVELRKSTNLSELSMTLVNDSVIELKGCDTPDSLRGVGLNFVVVDEYAIIPDAIDLWGMVLRPLLADKKGRALFIGTPAGLNAFHDLYIKGQRKEDEFTSYLFHTSDNPYIAPEEIEKMKKELPPTIFAQECLCSFLTSSERVLIKLDAIEALKKISHNFKDRRRAMGADPSQGGDACVAFILENGKILEKHKSYQPNAMATCGEWGILARKWKLKSMAIDGIGIGGPMICRLRELGYEIRDIQSASSQPDDNFANLRAAMWWHAMEEIVAGKIPYPDDNELIRQLTSVQFKTPTSAGKFILESKDDTKKRLGCSPDDADAFVYALWQLKYAPIFNEKDYGQGASDNSVTTAVKSAWGA
jgi:hypothetical protein